MGQERDFAQLKNFQDVGIIILKGEGEGHEVESREWRLGFHGEEVLSRFQIEGHFSVIGQEKTLGNHILFCIQELVHDLKPQIGHADPIMIRVG